MSTVMAGETDQMNQPGMTNFAQPDILSQKLHPGLYANRNQLGSQTSDFDQSSMAIVPDGSMPFQSFN